MGRAVGGRGHESFGAGKNISLPLEERRQLTFRSYFAPIVKDTILLGVMSTFLRSSLIDLTYLVSHSRLFSQDI